MDSPYASHRGKESDVVDVLPDPVICLDDQRNVAFWNRAAERLYGYSREEALGRPLADLLRTRFPQPCSEVLAQLAETGCWFGVLAVRGKNGGELTVESRWTARHDHVGGVVVVDRDLGARGTGVERIQSQLHRAQRLESIGQLAAGIAHDFNNSLAVIINYASLVASELDRAEHEGGRESWTAARADLSEIERAAARAARLTHQLLAFSRHDVGRPAASRSTPRTST